MLVEVGQVVEERFKKEDENSFYMVIEKFKSQIHVDDFLILGGMCCSLTMALQSIVHVSVCAA